MTPVVRHCTVLIVDIAGSVALRADVGEAEAGQRIRQLLQDLAQIVRANGCTFLKSYGDDLIATFEGPDHGASLAAESAIALQRRAEAVHLQLYAGLCEGPVEFVESMGHPDAYGQAMNLAARLHKLTEDAPGRIFLPAELVKMLPGDLQHEASLFSTRHIKGYGPMEVWTLSWRDHSSTVTYVPPKNPGAEASSVMRAGPLALWHRGKRMDLDPAADAFVIGRAPSCSLQVPDPEPRISSRHLTIEIESDLWMAHDVSRNGCWVRDERTGEEFPLLPGAKARLPARGAICLGRSFVEDPGNVYVVYFEAALRALKN
jgi:class 3 adenylate cyclase